MMSQATELVDTLDEQEAHEEFLKDTLPRANFVTRTTNKQFASTSR